MIGSAAKSSYGGDRMVRTSDRSLQSLFSRWRLRPASRFRSQIYSCSGLSLRVCSYIIWFFSRLFYYRKLLSAWFGINSIIWFHLVWACELSNLCSTSCQREEKLLGKTFRLAMIRAHFSLYPYGKSRSDQSLLLEILFCCKVRSSSYSYALILCVYR